MQAPTFSLYKIPKSCTVTKLVKTNKNSNSGSKDNGKNHNVATNAEVVDNDNVPAQEKIAVPEPAKIIKSGPSLQTNAAGASSSNQSSASSSNLSIPKGLKQGFKSSKTVNNSGVPLRVIQSLPGVLDVPLNQNVVRSPPMELSQVFF